MSIRACVAVAWSVMAFAAVAQTSFTYQGRLESAGAAATGNADFKFRLYGQASGGPMIGSELTRANVGVSKGVFATDLDFGDAAFLPGSSRWLEIDVRMPAGGGSYVTLSPRAAVSAAPLAQGIAGIAMTRAGAQSVDQNQFDGFWGGAVTDRIDFTPTWESFTAGKTGALTGVALDGSGVVNGSASAMTIQIYSGVGTSGAMLGSTVVMVPQGQSGSVPVASFPNITVTAGSKYTIAPTGTVFLVKPNNLIAGSVVGPTNANPFLFKTYVTPEATIATKASRAGFADASAKVDWLGVDNVPANVRNAFSPWVADSTGCRLTGSYAQIDTGSLLQFGGAAENLDPIALRRFNYTFEQSGLELILGNDNGISGANDAFIITASGVTLFQFNTQSGGQALKAGGGSWGVLSDARAKRDIEPLDGALDRLLRLRGRTYFYSDPSLAGASDGRCTGFVAQEVEPFFPEWIGESRGMKTLNIKGFEALTVESLRELRAEKDLQIENLKAENRDKQREIDDLKARLERLERAVLAK
ncbi:MAG: tail fiber domain-containing protein [Phycisphaerales bacterium]|nr:tail fiber domain-containing protein [Planctomycetota bacterium]